MESAVTQCVKRTAKLCRLIFMVPASLHYLVGADRGSRYPGNGGDYKTTEHFSWFIERVGKVNSQIRLTGLRS
jgi:hypothetical protein